MGRRQWRWSRRDHLGRGRRRLERHSLRRVAPRFFGRDRPGRRLSGWRRACPAAWKRWRGGGRGWRPGSHGCRSRRCGRGGRSLCLKVDHDDGPPLHIAKETALPGDDYLGACLPKCMTWLGQSSGVRAYKLSVTRLGVLTVYSQCFRFLYQLVVVYLFVHLDYVYSVQASDCGVQGIFTLAC